MSKITTLCQAVASISYFPTRMNRSSQLGQRTSLPFAFTLVLTFLLSLVRVGDVWGQVNLYTFSTGSGANLASMTGSTSLIGSGIDDGVSAVTNIGSMGPLLLTFRQIQTDFLDWDQLELLTPGQTLLRPLRLIPKLCLFGMIWRPELTEVYLRY